MEGPCVPTERIVPSVRNSVFSGGGVRLILLPKHRSAFLSLETLAAGNLTADAAPTRLR
ncbi:unnamed protein product [Amoebophrya sp. A25]|nr:unnamed protein product [Amoebophrya sp. A25]|eukprot:GSA25T00016718001.1